MIIDWPGKILIPHAIKAPWLDMYATMGTPSLDGTRYPTLSPAAHWRYSFSVHLKTQDQRRMFRALGAMAGYSEHPFRITFADENLWEWTGTGAEGTGLRIPTAAGVPHSDGSTFSDGTGYAATPISGLASAAAAIEATSLNIDLPAGVQIMPGDKFSTGDHAYMIRSVAAVSGSTVAVTFLPRLRAAIAQGARINLSQIKCLMRVEDPSVFHTDHGLLQFGEATLTFVEVPHAYA